MPWAMHFLAGAFLSGWVGLGSLILFIFKCFCVKKGLVIIFLFLKIYVKKGLFYCLLFLYLLPKSTFNTLYLSKFFFVYLLIFVGL